VCSHSGAGRSIICYDNRIYRGEVVHKGLSYPGEHIAIVDEDLWNAVQAKLAGLLL
jgi:hypothetical protein